MEEKTVCFACGTEYQLLIAFILSTTVYSRNTKLLLLCKDPRLSKYYEPIKDIQLWDEVKIIDPKLPLEELDAHCAEITPALDILHLFTWGLLPFNRLFAVCRAKKKKIILTDEGVGTYMPYARFNSWVSQHDPQGTFTEGVDLKSVDEIWLLNPELYSDQEFAPIKKIDIEEFYTAALNDLTVMDKYKRLFHFLNEPEFIAEQIYFRQYYSLVGYISPEADAFVDSHILRLLDPSHLFIKDHPAYLDHPYFKKPEGRTLEIPWEALIIYARLANSRHIRLPRVFISASSSVMFNSNSLKAYGDFIFVHKLFELYTDYKDQTISTLIEKCKTVFPASRFYEPPDWAEYYELILQIESQQKFGPPTISFNIYLNEEVNWLRERYLVLYQDQKQLKSQLDYFYIKARDLSEQVQNSGPAVARQQEVIQELNYENAQYALSKSWRLTRPFRKIARALRKNKND